MKSIFIILFIVIISPTVFAQPLSFDWGKNYTANTLNASSFSSEKMIADSNGDLIVAGITDTIGNNYQIGLLKLDTAGTVQWQLAVRYYSTLLTKTQKFHDIAVDVANNIYVAYETEDSLQFGNSRWCAMKIAPNGSIVWNTMYTGIYGDAAYPTSLALDNTGNVYMTGLGNNTNLNDAAMVTIKLNASGALAWEQLIDGNSTNFGSFTSAGMDVVYDNNGHIYVTGSIANFDTIDHYDLVLVKYTTAGTALWTKVVDDTVGFRYQMGQRVLIDANGDIIVGGYSSSVYQNYYNDIMLLKYNPSGTLLWKKNHTDNVDETLEDMMLDYQSNIVVVGGRTPFFGFTGYTSQLIKFNTANGDTLWTFGVMNTDWIPKSVTTDGSGAVFAWGIASFNLPAPTPYLYALNPQGQLLNALPYSNNTVNDMHAQNLIYSNGKLYGSLYAGNNATLVYNGLLCKYSWSNSTGISEADEATLTAFPNPLSDVLHIQGMEGQNRMYVTDAMGKIVFEELLSTANTMLHTGSWVPGFYFIYVNGIDARQVLKVVKQ